MATLNLTVVDPAGSLAGLPLLVPTVRAAVAHLDQFLVIGGTLDVEVRVAPIATGRIEAIAGILTTTSVVGGRALYEPGAFTETRTGIDFDPARPEIVITVDPRGDYATRELWWDPAIATGLGGSVPSDRTDAFSVLLHELVHGLGVTGYRDTGTGAISTPYWTMWDSWLRVADGQASFTGPNVQALLGRELEVAIGGSQGAYHLGVGDGPAQSRQPLLDLNLMNAWALYRGERYTLDRLDLAILQDIGWSLESGVTLLDVIQPLDDGQGPRYRVGYDGDEAITGGPVADRLEGRGGNDTLSGGTGLDLAAFRGPRADYAISAPSSGVHRVSDRVAGRDGVDLLDGVERIAFSDLRVALDLDGAAGSTARLLGAVFGAPAVANKAYVGIGLSLFDAGQTPEQVAQLAIGARFGGTPSSRDLVTLLYTNVVGVAPGAAELSFYAGLVDGGTYTQAGLALLAANTDLTAASIGLAGLAASGLEFLPA